MSVQQNVVASGGAATCFFSQDKDRSYIVPEEASSANYISSAVSEPSSRLHRFGSSDISAYDKRV